MAPKITSPEALPTLHRGILLTVLYSDLFDHPLTVDELHRFSLAPCSERRTLEEAIEALSGHYLTAAGGFVCWRGREATIETRRRRRQLAAGRWPPARRFARWLGWVPYLRMVAVCGSQAVENGDEEADVDLFLITAPGRLWLVQAATMTLRRAGRWLGVDLCPNYLMTTDSLAIERRDLYTAREIAQAVPLWGRRAYEDFLAANPWIDGFLPNLRLGEGRGLPEPRPRHRLTAQLERLLGGSLGDGLDRAVHRVLLRYYRWRLRKHGWSRDDIERCYRRDRQTVITGGYAAAVARRFADHCAGALGGEVPGAEIEHVFFGDEVAEPATEERATPDPLYAGLLATRYGGGR